MQPLELQASQLPYLNSLTVDSRPYRFFDLTKIIDKDNLQKIPYSLRVMLENVVRNSPNSLALVRDNLLSDNKVACDVPYFPNRLMFHDTTCLPALCDFAAMRNMVDELGGNAKLINPTIPAVLTIDHSVIVEHFDDKDAVEKNLDIDFRRNKERYEFIKWAQESLDNFYVIPPGTGIIHQMNMEAIAKIVWETPLTTGETLLHGDNMVATDSHTPMINALAVLGWGIGGLEGQAALMGEPVTLTFPKTVGIKVTGKLPPQVTATDITLRVAKILRERNMVGKFVEFTGDGLDNMSIATRATIANMAPEYGATVVFFPYDDKTEAYLRLSGREEELIANINAYMHAQSLYRNEFEPIFDELIELDLASIGVSVAGPALPHQLQNASNAGKSFDEKYPVKQGRIGVTQLNDKVDWHHIVPEDGLVLMSAITSCTNTANPTLMIQAGLLAKKAHALGLNRKAWVKTSLSPGSRVVLDYLTKANLIQEFEAIGFGVVGFGCMTCIGNSGSLPELPDEWVDKGLKGVVVLSGNRNFSGRVNPKLPAGYLASPALCIAYAIAGTIHIDITKDVIAYDKNGNPVYLKDLLPTDEEVADIEKQVVSREFFVNRKAQVWQGTHHWQELNAKGSKLFDWDLNSTYLRRPEYLHNVAPKAKENIVINNAHALFVVGDNVTTDHISPAYSIPPNSLAGQWLLERGEDINDLNQYSTRRSNHEVMLRGAFTNPAVENLQLSDNLNAPKGQGVWTYNLDGTVIEPVYTASQEFINAGIPNILFAGINYGSGSSRDWAAKAAALLGIKAVVARSVERIHRSNLVGMGIFPLLFKDGQKVEDLQLTGKERFDFDGLNNLAVGDNAITMLIHKENGDTQSVELRLPIDSSQEILYLQNGGILPFVIRKTINR